MAGTAATIATQWSTEDQLGGIALHAAGLVAASAQDTAVFLGKGDYLIKTVVSAIEIADNDELFVVDIEGDLDSAAATYYRLGTIFADGAKEITGRAVDGAVGTYYTVIRNPLDNNVRETTNISGTVGTGINFTVTAYPLAK